MIKIENISKAFLGKPILKNISLEFVQGKTYAIFGDNGSGKTVFSKILYGIYPPDSGVIKFNEIEKHFLFPSDSIKAGVGYVPQLSFLPTDLFINDLSILTGIDLSNNELDFLFKFDESLQIDKLSLNDHQFLELKIALLRHPKVLILDEFILFSDNRHIDTWQHLKNYCFQNAIILILITHEIDIAKNLVDYYYYFKNGNAFSKEEVEKGGGLFNYSNTLEHDLYENIVNINANEFFDTPVQVVNKLIELSSQERLTVIYYANVKNNSSFFLKLISSIELNRRAYISSLMGNTDTRGLALELSVFDNLILNLLPHLGKRHFFLFNKKKLKQKLNSLISEFGITPCDSTIFVKDISGGNKQRLAWLNLLLERQKIKIVINPFRGLDINGITLIIKKIIEEYQSTKFIFLTDNLEDILYLNTKMFYNLI